MRLFTFVFISFFLHLTLSAQTVVGERVSDLMPENYAIQGDAILKEFDTGVSTLSLSDDFNTPVGPDVRIFLGAELSLAGAVEIVNLSSLGHFSGSLSVDLPEDVGIEDYQYVLFFCVQFQQFWASGEFGETTNPGGDFICATSETMANDGAILIDLCPSDNIMDIVNFSNSLIEPTGDHYAYLLTDENEVLQEVVLNSFYDFEASGMETQRVYGIHYDGELNSTIGANRLETTATACFVHSEGNYLTITKSACENSFECSESLTATTDWVAEVEICATDGEDDIIALRNNLFIAPGDHYAYLLTDTNEILEAIILDSTYNFEGMGEETHRIYGLSYDGELNEMIGQHRSQTTATGCHTHSGDNLFLTILKTGCAIPFECTESLTATTDWVAEVEICATDGEDDIIALRNNLFIAPGDHYAYLLTDTNEILEAVILDSTYNFEGMGEETHRIYGLSYDGELNEMIGQHRSQTTATGCHTHSGDNLFLTILKTSCATPFECSESLTATTDWITEVQVCPSDGEDDIIALRNNLFIAPGDHYAYLLTDTNEILEAVILDSTYNFEGMGEETHRIYGLSYDGELNEMIGQHRSQTTATGCHTHSGDNLFLTILKTGCEVYECRESLIATHNWEIVVDICATDGEADEVFIQNNIQVDPGSNYVFLLTDTNEILQEIITDTIYDFEGMGTEEQRIYGLSYSGNLTSAIGEHRTNTTASNCYIHSGSNLFLTINKTTACATSVSETTLAQQITAYPNPVSEVLHINIPKEFKPTSLTIF